MIFNTKDDVIRKVISHIELFESFENLYLFGSILDEVRLPNDIDLLLIYKKFSNEILRKIDEIISFFDFSYGLSFDLTVLSEYEEYETDFIIKLKSNYIKIK